MTKINKKIDAQNQSLFHSYSTATADTLTIVNDVVEQLLYQCLMPEKY